ncbi:MAG: histidine phosphatase family protein [Acidobacteria bacterium]|nr:histidine phosphatase family protein [Acidobacteriota bacterium]
MKRLYLVRHGETEWNADNRGQGSIDIPLSKNGIAQAEALGEYLNSLPKPQKIYCSDLKRAVETAKTLSKILEVENIEINPLLKEINCGLWEGKFIDDLAKNYSKDYAMWRLNSSFRCPEGESVEDVRERVEKFFIEKRIELSCVETAMVVAHGIFNRAVLSFIMDLPLQNCRYFEQDNGALNVFVWGEVMPHLALWNYSPNGRD